MKRTDLTLRNKTNNPMYNSVTREKMRQSLIGKKLPQEVKDKMSATRKRIIAKDPNVLKNMLNGAEKKYLSKVRGSGWKSSRIRALKRDCYTCKKCGRNEKRLIVHHLDWKGKRRNIPMSQWNNNLDNLLTLCDKCHNGIHRHKSKDYSDRYNKMIAP